MTSVTEITIKSKEYIKSFSVTDLYKNTINVNNGKPFNIDNNWFLVKVPYTGTYNEIEDILINGNSLDNYIYVGFFVDSAVKKVQPCTALYEKGEYNIWLHPNFGFLKASYLTQFRWRDISKNLFEKYLLTEDFSTNINDSGENFEDGIKEFFKYPYGPRWWKKDDITTPYVALDNDLFSSINKKELEQEINNLTGIHVNYKKHWHGYSLKQASGLPVEPISKFSGNLRKLLEVIGYTGVLDISTMYLEPYSVVHQHIDNQSDRENWPYHIGPRQFYWNLSSTDGVHFKFDQAGLIPMESPLLVNTSTYSHAVVNNTPNIRLAVIMYGIFGEPMTYEKFEVSTA